MNTRTNHIITNIDRILVFGTFCTQIYLWKRNTSVDYLFIIYFISLHLSFFHQLSYLSMLELQTRTGSDKCFNLSFLISPIYIASSIWCEQLEKTLQIVFFGLSIVNLIFILSYHLHLKRGCIEDSTYTIQEHHCIGETCPVCPCIICFESIDKMVQLQCNHQIHFSCFQKWKDIKEDQYNNITCPMCRSDV
jgi:Ring finger domain